ncbi:hypothetical protein AAD018_010940 [Aestuariibius insulae]|uniref:hypothetical protein n=1 Tax=Aestuariibius insulae TaxID=2058287 RepID=UPI00345EF880
MGLRLWNTGAAGILAILAGCGPTTPQVDTSDPAVAALMAETPEKYAASADIARRIAAQCSRYAYDAGRKQALDAVRQSQGMIAPNRGGFDLELDVSERVFLARNNLSSFNEDLCLAGDAEESRASSIAALLVPV